MCVFIAAGAIAAVGAVAGGAIAAGGAKSAGEAQANAARDASNTQLAMYDQTRTDQAPWRQAGGSALDALTSYYGLPGADGKTPNPTTTAANDNKLIQNLPGYQFNLQQGNQAVQRNLAANGLLDSGAAQKALTQYGQGMATQATGQYLNGLQSLAGLGQTATANTGAVGANTANQVGSNQIYAGNAQASGYANQANAVNSGLSGLAGVYGNYQQQQNMQYGPAYQGATSGFGAAGGGDYNATLNQVYSPTYTP